MVDIVAIPSLKDGPGSAWTINAPPSPELQRSRPEKIVKRAANREKLAIKDVIGSEEKPMKRNSEKPLLANEASKYAAETEEMTLVDDPPQTMSANNHESQVASGLHSEKEEHSRANVEKEAPPRSEPKLMGVEAPGSKNLRKWKNPPVVHETEVLLERPHGRRDSTVVDELSKIEHTKTGNGKRIPLGREHFDMSVSKDGLLSSHVPDNVAPGHSELPLSGSNADAHDQPLAKNWLADRDMLPGALEACRILSFEYPWEKIRTESSLQILDAAGRELVRLLDKERQTCTNRPIVFVACADGGIVIEKALALSRDVPSGSVSSRTAGIVFLNTTFLVPELSEMEKSASILPTGATVSTEVEGGISMRIEEAISSSLHTLFKNFTNQVKDLEIPLLFGYKASAPEKPASKTVSVSNTSSRLKEKVVEEDRVIPIEGYPSFEFHSTLSSNGKFSSPNDVDFARISGDIASFVRTWYLRRAIDNEDRTKVSKTLSDQVTTVLQSHFGLTPLDLAIRRGSPKMVRQLAGYAPTHVLHRDKNGFTPLHYAVQNAVTVLKNATKGNDRDEGNAKDIIKFLLQKGSNANVRDNEGRSAWDLAKGDSWSSISDLRNYRPIVKGPSDPVPPIWNEPATSELKLKACEGFQSTIAEFYDIDGTEARILERPSVVELLYTPGDSPETILEDAKPKQGGKRYFVDKKRVCRWFHLPANNVQ